MAPRKLNVEHGGLSGDCPTCLRGVRKLLDASEAKPEKKREEKRIEEKRTREAPLLTASYELPGRAASFFLFLHAGPDQSKQTKSAMKTNFSRHEESRLAEDRPLDRIYDQDYA